MQRKKRSLKKKGAPAPKPADAHPKRRRRARIRLNTKLRSAITTHLSAHGGASADQIRKELKMGHATIVRALTRMQSTGDVTSTGNGRRHWYLTPEKGASSKAASSGATGAGHGKRPVASGGQETSLDALATQIKLLALQMVSIADLLRKEIQEKDEILAKLQTLFKK